MRERNIPVPDRTRDAASRASAAPSRAAREKRSIVPETEFAPGLSEAEMSDIARTPDRDGGMEAGIRGLGFSGRERLYSLPSAPEDYSTSLPVVVGHAP